MVRDLFLEAVRQGRYALVKDLLKNEMKQICLEADAEDSKLSDTPLHKESKLNSSSGGSSAGSAGSAGSAAVVVTRSGMQIEEVPSGSRSPSTRKRDLARGINSSAVAVAAAAASASSGGVNSSAAAGAVDLVANYELYSAVEVNYFV